MNILVEHCMPVLNMGDFGGYTLVVAYQLSRLVYIFSLRQ